MTPPISLELPYPPSVNSLWRAVNGRSISSRAYRHWMKCALGDIMAARPFKTIDGPYRLAVVAHRPDKRRRDLGNLEKPISDALVKGGVIADDCNAERIMLCWSDSPPSRTARVIVRVTPEQSKSAPDATQSPSELVTSEGSR